MSRATLDRPQTTSLAPRPSWSGVLWGLTRTRYLELVRQPVFGVCLLVGIALVALSPALAIFSLGNADALVLDLGASALLFFLVLLSALVIAAGSAERFGDGTTALVLSHPVSPLTVVLAEFLGAALALGQAASLLGFTLAWASRNGPDHIHWGVVAGGGVSLVVALAWGIRASLANKSFVAGTIGAATLLFPVAWLASQFLGHEGTPMAYEPAPALVLEAAIFGWQASLTFAAAGICLSTRLGGGAAAGGTLLMFVLGSLVRGPLGTESLGPIGHLSLLLPDLQLYWVGDAGYAEKSIPLDYMAQVFICTLLYAQIALGLASFSLERREF
ncbi:MAG: hypothetical protein JKY65_32100 [Planctomycetes bacterium]|nr:hypothetical protein [Planctomycetota bacterium]